MPCPDCDREFTSANGLNFHRRQVHRPAPAPPAPDPLPKGDRAVLLKCRHCGETQIELIDLRRPPASLLCAECSNRAAERDGVGLCERDVRRPWADWPELARRTIEGAASLREIPPFRPGTAGLLQKATSLVSSPHVV